MKRLQDVLLYPGSWRDKSCPGVLWLLGMDSLEERLQYPRQEQLKLKNSQRQLGLHPKGCSFGQAESVEGLAPHFVLLVPTLQDSQLFPLHLPLSTIMPFLQCTLWCPLAEQNRLKCLAKITHMVLQSANPTTAVNLDLKKTRSDEGDYFTYYFQGNCVP